jgi:hypothetical protein
MTSAPIFIVGTPRSGTTLMARILGNHSILYRPGETHFMQDIYARRATIGDLETDPAARGRVSSGACAHFTAATTHRVRSG